MDAVVSCVEFDAWWGSELGLGLAVRLEKKFIGEDEEWLPREIGNAGRVKCEKKRYRWGDDGTVVYRISGVR